MLSVGDSATKDDAVNKNYSFLEYYIFIFIPALRAGDHTARKEIAAANATAMKILTSLVPGPTAPLP